MKIYKPRSIFEVSLDEYLRAFERAGRMTRIDFRTGAVVSEPAPSLEDDLETAIEHMKSFKMEGE